MAKKIYIDNFNSPLGHIEITANDADVLSIYFVDKVTPTRTNSITELAKTQLLQYFDGTLKVFDLPLAPTGTDFQEAVWRALTTVPYGATCSYAEIATIINNRQAVRAVGAANGKNPMTIVVPCHRVIGSNGTLTGYAAGVERKAWLLKHESASLY